MIRSHKLLVALAALVYFSSFCDAQTLDGVAPRTAVLDGAAVSVDSGQDTPPAQDAPETDKRQVSAASGAFDETVPFALAAQPSAQNARSVLGTVGIFARMILVLAFVIACIYGFVWFMKRSVTQSNNSDQFLRVVASITLSPGKYVKIVSLLDEKAYLLGVSDNAVNVIAEVENKETISAMNLYADKMAQTNKPKNFEDILNIFMPGGPKGGALRGRGSAFGGEDAADVLRQMRSTVGGTFGGEDAESGGTQ